MNNAIVKKYFQFVFLIYFLLLSTVATGQSNSKIEKQFEKARKYYLMKNIQDAIDEAQKIVDKYPEFVNASLLLADIYYGLDSTKLEIKYLENALKYDDNPSIYYRLAGSSYSIAMYQKAKDNYAYYLEHAKVTDVRKAEVARLIESCEFAIDAQKHPVEFQPIRLSSNVNTSNDEYWPSLSLDQQELVFTRLIKIAGLRPHEDFFISEFEHGDWGLAQPIVEINTRNNEGAESLSANGRYLFFTACNRGDGVGSCDIYYSKRVNGKWSPPRNVGTPVNSQAWESQPSFSSDNKYLYYSSTRKGGIGKKDIWRTEFKGVGAGGKILWGQPENLGDSINTPGDEISPFMHANNKGFYFASDYRTGMGGFDLFTAKMKADETFEEAENLGFPINTVEDEQGLNISADGTTAFFASARIEGMGLDIYNFPLEDNMRPDPVTYAKIKVVDAESLNGIQAKIELLNLFDTSQRRAETADENGEAMLCFPLGAKYAFTVSEKGYLLYSESFELEANRSIAKPYSIEIELQPVKVGSEMNLYNIYFETDSFRILSESEPELQKLITFLDVNSELEIEIQGHTDNTGSTLKNNQLSQLRSNSVVQFLINAGISRNRLKAKGLGEEKPVASNDTQEGRRLNRRTTIKITAK